MTRARRKEIEHHLSEDELDAPIADTKVDHILRRLLFVKNLYKGDTLEEAADRVSRSDATATRWAKLWNEGGMDALAPNFGVGRPPKLDEADQQRLLELLGSTNPGHLNRYDSYPMRNLLFHIILRTLVDSSGRSGCTTRNLDQNGRVGQITPTRFSTMHSKKPISRTTNAKVTTMAAGCSTTKSARTGGRWSAFRMHHGPSRPITASASGGSPSRPSSDPCFTSTARRSAATCSTGKHHHVSPNAVERTNL